MVARAEPEISKGAWARILEGDLLFTLLPLRGCAPTLDLRLVAMAQVGNIVVSDVIIRSICSTFQLRLLGRRVWRQRVQMSLRVSPTISLSRDQL